jgi:hypothetical protein
MTTIEERARAFVAEQSEGEWGDDLIARDAAKLVVLIRAAETDARNAALEEAVQQIVSVASKSQTLRLHMGELSAQEVRAIRAFVNWRAEAILALKAPQ